MHALLVLGPAAIVVGLITRWTASKVGRWLGDAAKASFAEIVTAVVTAVFDPRFEHLERKLDDVQARNTADHGAVAARMSSLEAEVGRMESRLAAVEAAINTNTKESSA